VGNFDIMQELFAPDFVSHSPLGNLSREEVAATLSAMRDALTDFEMATPVTFLDGNRAATMRTIKGTFDRELSTPNGVIAPNGNPVQLEMNCVIRFDEEGRIAEEPIADRPRPSLNIIRRVILLWRKQAQTSLSPVQRVEPVTARTSY
jgi:hypothetical protein